jgi:hypothetical protein
MKVVKTRFQRLAVHGARNCIGRSRHCLESLSHACKKSGSYAFRSTDKGKNPDRKSEKLAELAPGVIATSVQTSDIFATSFA